MIYLVIVVMIAAILIIIGNIIIATTVDDATKELKKIWSALDDIRYEMHPDEVPSKECVKVMIDELKDHCKGQDFCYGCDYAGACPGYVTGTPDKWGETE